MELSTLTSMLEQSALKERRRADDYLQSIRRRSEKQEKMQSYLMNAKARGASEAVLLLSQCKAREIEEEKQKKS